MLWIFLIVTSNLPLQPASSFDSVLGRWNVTFSSVDGTSYPSWFEVSLRKSDELMGRFVGRVGSARYASSVSLINDQFVLKIPTQYEQGLDEVVLQGSISDAVISGRSLGERGQELTWKAVRAPDLFHSPPVLWHPHEQLLNRNDLTGWRLRNSGGSNNRHMANGILSNDGPTDNVIK